MNEKEKQEYAARSIARLAVFDHCAEQFVEAMIEAFEAVLPNNEQLWAERLEFRPWQGNGEWVCGLFFKTDKPAAPMLTLALVCHEERVAAALARAMNAMVAHLDSFVPEEGE